MKKESSKKRYVADFETACDNKDKTYVWAWALCSCEDYSTEYGTSIKTFFEKISKLDNDSVVYFHNLKFDGSFILYYLLNNNFTQAKEDTKKPLSFTTFVNSMGEYYTITIRFNTKCKITIADSLKKLPFKVAQIAKSLGLPEEKGHIDYLTHRDEGGILTDEDKDYIRRDVEIVARAMKEMFFNNEMYGLTIGSDCMKEFKTTLPQFSNYFPKLDDWIDKYCRKAYRGGISYVNPKVAGMNIYSKGYVYDVNSLYPSVMHSSSNNLFPAGQPEYFDGEYQYDPDYPIFICRCLVMIKVKEGKIPFIQYGKGSWFRRQNEFITDETTFPIELFLTSVDYDLMFECYDVISCQMLDGFKFHANTGFFDKYIDKWFSVKAEATKTGNKVLRQLAKLMINNLYGKFATSTNGDYFTFSIEGNKLTRDAEEDIKPSVYVPVGAFVTSYGHKKLVESINANIEYFCYCDTDSMHLLKMADNIEVDDTELGKWALESTFTEAKYLRQKCYAEKINDQWIFKCAGLPEETRSKLTIDEFYCGSVIKDGKLISKQVEGGVVLVPTDFEIKDRL